MATRVQPVVMMGNWMLVSGLASLFAGDFSGMIPEPTGTTAIATNPVRETVRRAWRRESRGRHADFVPVQT
jgi:POT family proton-dependent oligopeptide transporter